MILPFSCVRYSLLTRSVCCVSVRTLDVSFQLARLFETTEQFELLSSVRRVYRHYKNPGIVAHNYGTYGETLSRIRKN